MESKRMTLREVLTISRLRRQGAVSEFKHEADAFREQCQDVVEQDKALDRNFEKEFEDLGEFLSQIYRFFRKRQATIATGDKGKQPAGKDTRRDGERRTVLSAKDWRNLASPASGPAYQLDPVNDMPEDMEVDQWHRFLRYRDRKIAHEEEVRGTHAHLAEMTTYLDELIAVDDTNRKQIAASLRTLTEFRESREKQRRSLGLVFHVKAGLVEMQLKPLEGDYTDASLMARTIIEEFNELVLKRDNVKLRMVFV